jgi:ATP adenylyltransferase
MENLWAPWRGEFINAEKRDDCIFCTFPGEARDPENLILGRSARSFVILNKFPYNNGHLMVIPLRHTDDFTSLDADETLDLHQLLQLSVRILGDVYRPQGFNIGMNVGAVAGAGIAGHIHHHVVPRWGGDTNFMPVIGATKVMIEHLQTTYEKLRPRFDQALAAGARPA